MLILLALVAFSSFGVSGVFGRGVGGLNLTSFFARHGDGRPFVVWIARRAVRTRHENTEVHVLF